MKEIGSRIWRGFIFGITLCVFIPMGMSILGMLSAFFGTTMFAEWAFRFFCVYAFVPVSFLSYPDVSPKLGIPATAFGIACVLVFWLVIAVIVGLIHVVFHSHLKERK